MELRYIHLTDAVEILQDPVSSSYAVIADSGWLHTGTSTLRTLVLSDFYGTWELKMCEANDNDFKVYSHETGRWIDDTDEETGSWGTLKWLKPGVPKRPLAPGK